jgi:hypothetical protein
MLFWSLYWHASRRGGHYVFIVPYTHGVHFDVTVLVGKTKG